MSKDSPSQPLLSVVVDERQTDRSRSGSRSSTSSSAPLAGTPSTKASPVEPLRPPVVVALILALIVTSVASAVARKKLYDAFGHDYDLFRQWLTNFMYDIWATIAVIGRLVWLKYSDSNPANRDDAPKTSGGPSSTWTSTGVKTFLASIPFLSLAGIAMMDGTADFLQSVSGQNTPGSWTTLLSQSRIFFVLVFSVLWLGSKYMKRQYIGALIAISGACLAILPQISGCHGCLWYSVVIYSCADIPIALSTVWKEVVFKRTGLDVFTLTTVVSWIQVCLIWVFLPVSQLKGFGGTPLSSVGREFRHGFRCFAGDNAMPVTDENGVVLEFCSSKVTALTFTYSLSGFLAGILGLIVVRRVSASVQILAQAVSLPIANLLFASRLIMGSNRDPLNLWNVGGLVLVLLGFLLFQYPSGGLKPNQAAKAVKAIEDE